MEFISERTIGGRNFVLLEEVTEYVESKKIALLLKSGGLQIFERVPAGVIEPGSIAERELAIEHYGEDLSDAVWNNMLTWPESVRTIGEWWPELGYDFFILADIARQIIPSPSSVSPKEFLLSIRYVLNGILAVTRDVSGAEALKRAKEYLNRNPCGKIDFEWLTAENFPECSDPLVTYRGHVANTILAHNGFSQMSQQEIKKILAVKK